MAQYEERSGDSGPDTRHDSSSGVARIVIGGALGNAMEWYDFALYGYLAATMGKVFFPTESSINGLLNLFAIFGIAFLVRPLGGWILGPLGDRRGRQFALVFSLVLMSVATFAVALIPSASTIGVAAPVILIALRLVQGFSAGGEFGPAVTYIAEHAPANRRGFLASFIQFSSIAGFLVASLVVTGVVAFVPQESLVTWGWRIPFLLALPAGAIGIYIRLRLQETPEFSALLSQRKVIRNPVTVALRREWRAVLRVAGIVALQQVAYYTVFTYLTSHVVRLGLSKTVASAATTAALVLAMLLVPVMGAVSDRIGRRPVLLTASAAFAIASVPIFTLIGMASPAVVIICQLLLAVGVAAYNAVTNATYAEYLHAQTRTGALSIGFNMGTMVFGAPALYVMTLLNARVGTSWAPAIYVVVAAVISGIAVLTLPRRGGNLLEVEIGRGSRLPVERASEQG